MLIPVTELIEKYDVKFTGVLHLGAHKAEEAQDYAKAGATKVLWVEGNPELMPALGEIVKKHPGHQAFNILISDRDNQEVVFSVTNNSYSSSILELDSHKFHHPEVKVDHSLTLKSQRIDTFVARNHVDTTSVTFLNIDLQGAELLALKSLGSLLDQIQYVYAEVSTCSLYVNCPKLSEIDAFLHAKGFFRVATRMTSNEWGEALYVRRKLSPAMKIANALDACRLQFVGRLRRLIKYYRRLKNSRR